MGIIVLYDPFRAWFIISLFFYKYLTPMGSFKFWRIFYKLTLCPFHRFRFNDVLIVKYLTGDVCMLCCNLGHIFPSGSCKFDGEPDRVILIFSYFYSDGHCSIFYRFKFNDVLIAKYLTGDVCYVLR